MTSHGQAAYEALRAYLTRLMTAPKDRTLISTPPVLRADLESFLHGKTLYQDEHNNLVVHGHDLAAWAHQIVYVTGLSYPIGLAAVDTASLADVLAPH
ncbi:MAG: hypothetical protein EOO61_14145 [Hymenobacter sp.]|nr:MAG: hypothetical protein EOO61_14145 [Hymenobacter sp.]